MSRRGWEVLCVLLDWCVTWWCGAGVAGFVFVTDHWHTWTWGWLCWAPAVLALAALYWARRQLR